MAEKIAKNKPEDKAFSDKSEEKFVDTSNYNFNQRVPQQENQDRNSQPYTDPVLPPQDPKDPYANADAQAGSGKKVPLWTAFLSAVLASLLTFGGVIFAANNGYLSVGGEVYNFGSSSSITDAEIIKRAGSTLTEPNWEAVAQATGQAVVSITVTSSVSSAQGSGVIIDAEGYIVTNYHVIEGAQKIEVSLYDGSTVTAEIVGSDSTTDLAVLKISTSAELTAVPLEGGSELVVGQPVMAIGNPLGYANSVTTGIVSSLDRPIAASSGEYSNAAAVVTNAIQIDAAINPGNSGGPLFDGNGKIVGITSAIATTSDSSGNVGIGFAIPADLVKNVAEQIIETGRAKHGLLGVNIQDSSATVGDIVKKGTQVVSIVEGSGAAASDLQRGDLIIGIDGKSTVNTYALMGYIHTYMPEDEVTLMVVRDKKVLEVKVVLGEAVIDEPTATPEYTPGGQNGYEDDFYFFDPFGFFGN